MEHISNEQKAKEIAEKNLVRYCPQGTSYEECYQSAMQAMRWKDEQHTREKQQFVDKACEFFYDKLNGGDMDCGNIEKFIEDFKKVVKEKAFELANKINEDGGMFEIDALIEMAEWEKQQMIDKAAEWWKDELTYPSMTQTELDWSEMKITEFKKAMKGE